MSEYKPIEAVARRVRRYEDKGLIVHFTEGPNQEANFAMKLIEHFAVVAGNLDGEDSAGRAKLRLQTPEELVARAFAISEAAFTEARARGWMVALPMPESEQDQEPELTR